jgi:probable F420-dependent oxidoreductase
VKGNIVGRFGLEWTPPVARMRDYVSALRAIWKSWQHGSPLAFESEHYRLTRMQPFFNPGPIEHPDIPICIGAVNRGMTRLAGELAAGLMTHPTNTNPRYLREVTLPALRAGAERAGRAAEASAVIASTFVATGPTIEAVARERERLRQYLGFLYSTPQYWSSLELHGLADVGRRLQELSRNARWTEMAAEITDEVFDRLVPSGTYEEIGPTLREWYGGVVTGMTLRMPDDPRGDDQLSRLINAVKEFS